MESFSILFIRPVALALRLYGNIFGGETMLTSIRQGLTALLDGESFLRVTLSGNAKANKTEGSPTIAKEASACS